MVALLVLRLTEADYFVLFCFYEAVIQYLNDVSDYFLYSVLSFI